MPTVFDYWRGEVVADYEPTPSGFTTPAATYAASSRPTRAELSEYLDSQARKSPADLQREFEAIDAPERDYWKERMRTADTLTLARSDSRIASPAPAPVPRRQAGQEEGIAPAMAAGVALDDPCQLAKLFLAQSQYQHRDGKTLRMYQGEFAKWTEGSYSISPALTIRSEVVKFADHKFTQLHEAHARIAEDNATRGQPETKTTKKAATKVRVTRTLVGDVLQALQAFCQTPEGLKAPGWIGEGPEPTGLIAAPNGLLDLRSFAAGRRELIPATPRFLTFNRLDFKIDPHAPPPVRWIDFLDSLWPDDADSIRCLQEWFGYLLTPDTSRHKILMLIGPPRAGKGTIGRILKLLVGVENVVSPTLASLTERFGLQSFLGKSVALLADARLSNRADVVGVTEQLLSIAGEDSRTIDRKGLSPITTTLGTRFVCMSNELPRFGEASGALVSRLVILRLTRTFAGNPDLELLHKLIPELPGILLWSIEGWKRLAAAGRFTVPASASDLTEEATDLASPVATFLREACELGDTEEHTALKTDLFTAWQRWCRNRGREDAGRYEVFFRDLRAAVPTLKAKRGRSGHQRFQLYEGVRILSPIETGEIE